VTEPAPAERPRIPVAVVTGSRSEFGLLEGTIRRLAGSTSLEPRVVAAGMHLDPELGDTWREVAARFSITAKVPMSPPRDDPEGMALAVAEGIRGFAAAFVADRPAALLVLGDRIEPFAACIPAAYAGIPISHVHGGDVSGNAVDDFHRDAISRSARLHLAATERSRSRLLGMAVDGEVLVVGAPGLDAILAVPPRPRDEVLRKLGIPVAGPVLAVVQHPVPRLAGPEGEGARAEAIEVLEAALAWADRAGGAAAVLYPNNDAGHRAVIEEIERRRRHPRVRVFPSLPREDFVDLVRCAVALLGNSSSGIIESVSLGAPAVNVGERQAGRERNANVIDAPADRSAILAAIERAGSDPAVRAAVASRSNLYGDGRAAERIVAALERFLGRRSGMAAGPGGRAGDGEGR
jgi:GDP/UDP-N,N'-diacetylbacillosamine 2-epimerase (hydrolysing)